MARASCTGSSVGPRSMPSPSKRPWATPTIGAIAHCSKRWDMRSSSDRKDDYFAWPGSEGGTWFDHEFPTDLPGARRDSSDRVPEFVDLYHFVKMQDNPAGFLLIFGEDWLDNCPFKLRRAHEFRA